MTALNRDRLLYVVRDALGEKHGYSASSDMDRAPEIVAHGYPQDLAVTVMAEVDAAGVYAEIDTLRALIARAIEADESPGGDDPVRILVDGLAEIDRG